MISRKIIKGVKMVKNVKFENYCGDCRKWNEGICHDGNCYMDRKKDNPACSEYVEIRKKKGGVK